MKLIKRIRVSLRSNRIFISESFLSDWAIQISSKEVETSYNRYILYKKYIVTY